MAKKKKTQQGSYVPLTPKEELCTFSQGNELWDDVKGRRGRRLDKNRLNSRRPGMMSNCSF
jgi:hypothetical protein